MTLSSILVQTLPEHTEKLIEQLKKSDFCEYHLHNEKGKIIVTIEGETTGEEIQMLTQLQQMENVISAEMAYSFNEEELEQMRENMNIAEIPKWLNKEDVKAQDIVYHGDLKRRKRN